METIFAGDGLLE